MDPGSILNPTQHAVDPVFIFIIGVCLVLLVGIVAVMVWFVVRYHRSRSPIPTSLATGNVWLEIAWTFIPSLLVLAMFYYGWNGFLTLRTVPKGALEVKAIARMWSWSFTYPNGVTSSKLYVPVNKPVRVELVSQDVIHGFSLPAFRIKQDVVPGKQNYLWFSAPQPGSFDLFCSVYCGTGHSAMLTTVEVLPAAEFMDWLNHAEEEQAEKGGGRELLEKYGCLGCHSLDGTKKVGPTFKGLWGRQQVVVTNGVVHTITVDEAYLRRAILDPQADIVQGYPPVMPKNSTLPSQEMQAIIELIEHQK